MSEDEFRAARRAAREVFAALPPMPARALPTPVSCWPGLFVAYEKFQPGSNAPPPFSGAGASPRPRSSPPAPAPDDSIARAASEERVRLP